MNTTFQADDLWGWMYVRPPVDRILDPRGLDITGQAMPANVSITRVMTDKVAQFNPSGKLTAALTLLPSSDSRGEDDGADAGRSGFVVR